MAQSITRVFLGWDQPLLLTAVEWLARRYGSTAELNLSGVIVVVPGRRAGRRLLELLVQQAEADSRLLTPPRIETVGTLPESLYPLQRPLAGELVQQLTWEKVLRELDRELLEQVVPRPPVDDDTQAWLALGALLSQQHRELAADGLDFADVATRGREVPGFTEQARWDAMREVQSRYLRTLDELELWDVQTARLVAVRQREPRTDWDLVFVGTVDMNQVMRQMLDLVSDHVIALIAAPEELADRFDAHGCLQPSAWADAHVDVPVDRIRVCDGPAEQAEQVVRELAAFDGRYRADEIVIGLADERLGPFLERQLSACGVATRWIEGQRVADSGPCRLLLSVAALLERGRFEDFAALVRHPDIDDWFRRRTGQAVDLAKLDDEFRRYLPIAPDVPQVMRELINPLQRPPRPLNEWAESLRAWLLAMYGERSLDRDGSEGRIVAETLTRLSGILEEIGSVPENLAPIVSAGDAIRCAVQRTSASFVPPENADEAVEMLGWLELSLDDTSAAIVTTLNEGFVPTSLNSDLFLPNELRRHLGLNDNSRRYARDAYAVTLLQHARRDVVWLVGRRDVDGNPLVPSRLLFATQPAELPERVLRFLAGESESQPALPRIGEEGRGESPPVLPRIGGEGRGEGVSSGTGSQVSPLTLTLSPDAGEREPDNSRARTLSPDMREREPDRENRKMSFHVPTPEQIGAALKWPELITPVRELTLSVTEFKAYIACRYRYFLQHVLKLKRLNDDVVELDALAFGNVLHDVLRRFGESELRDATDVATLCRGLFQILDDVARKQFGERRRAVINVQLKQMEARLEAFARWQVRSRRDGWRIEFVERSFSRESSKNVDDSKGLSRNSASLSQPTFVVDGVPVWLRGRIDRIDRHESSGQWRIFDYKSGDAGDSPEQTHRKKDAWVDLQLPLYRHLWKGLALPGEVQLGYINLPKDTNAAGAKLAVWDDDALAAADAVAIKVAGCIARREFWPPQSPPPKWPEEFNDLCQVGVFGHGR